MSQAVRIVLLLIAAGLALTAVIAVAGWWMEPHRRMGRALRQVLGGPVDAMAMDVSRGQGAALRVDEGKIGVMRGFGDTGLVFDIDELIGAELIFDGHVAARVFRGEGRLPLNNISPSASRVALRLVFDDLRDPEFLLEMWSPADGAADDPAAADAVASARRWFARAEAVIRRG
ncbi:MAG: hypothetical protein ABIO37_16335 [Caulobacteraceae bacterium]